MANKYAIITPSELRAAGRKLGLKPGQLATRLKTPRRTVQDWQSGQRRIPGICDTAIELLLERDARFMAMICGGADPTPGQTITDLAMMVKELAQALHKAAPHDLLPIECNEYLRRNNLLGSPQDYQQEEEQHEADQNKV